MVKLIIRQILTISVVLGSFALNPAQENSSVVSYGEVQVFRFVDDKGHAYQGVNYIFDKNEKIVDLSPLVKEKCNKTITERVGQSLVEVRFSAESSAKSADVLQALRAVIEITQQSLTPLSVRGVRIYLLPVDKSIINYKILVPEENEYYQIIKPYKSLDEISLQCEKATSFCRDIFNDTPHELTHLSLWSMTANKREEDKSYPRWFEEGVAENIAAQVALKLAPVVAEYQLSTLSPEASLSRLEIRKKIFDWRRFETKADYPVTRFKWLSDNPSVDSYSWNQAALYGASRRLVELILSEAKKQGIENPLAFLFREMETQHKVRNSPLSNNEIMLLIRQKLRVEPTKLGEVSLLEKRQMVLQELSFLKQPLREGQTKKSNLETYKALSILAGLDVPIEESDLQMLLELVYDAKQSSTFRSLAATALAIRIKQPEFEVAVLKSLKGNSNFLNKSVKGIKSELQKLSLRPKLN